MSVAASDPNTASRLQRWLSSNRWQWRGLAALDLFGRVVALLVGVVLTAVIVDDRFHLAVAGRVAAWGVVVAAFGASLRLVARRWQTVRTTEDQIALAIEGRIPGGLQNRLINAVQLARQAGADEALRIAAVTENVEALRHVRLARAARARPALIRAGLAVLVVAAAVACWRLAPERFAHAMSRVVRPLAPIAPLFRTTLSVQPGDIEARGDVPLKIEIHGERPRTLVLERRSAGRRTRETLAVPDGSAAVEAVLRDVQHDTEYTVRGGDFRTPVYRVVVPRSLGLVRLRAGLRFPAYTRRADETAESTGDLTVLAGTEAKLTWTFDAPANQATLRTSFGADEDVPLTPLDGPPSRDWTATRTLDRAGSYRVIVAGQSLGPFAIRVQADQEPQFELPGAKLQAELAVDAVLPLRAIARDDIGLVEVGLFVRRLTDEPESPAADWRELAVWPGRDATLWRESFDLAATQLGAAEGDRVEVVLRARDACPTRTDWTDGPVLELTLGGDDDKLQREYEQLLRTERSLRGLVAAHESVQAETTSWLRRLEGADDSFRIDDPSQRTAFHAAVQKLNERTERLRSETAEAARAVPTSAGALRLGLALLADTEFVRVQRIGESVPSRETAVAKQAALADARVTHERIGRSLREIADQFASFRSDWELAHLIPFIQRLAERQVRLRDETLVAGAASPSELPSKTSGAGSLSHEPSHLVRRQEKLHALCRLLPPACEGLAERLQADNTALAGAFAAAGRAVVEPAWQEPFVEAVRQLQARDWPGATQSQTTAAEQLAAVHGVLQRAQADAARRALQALRDKARSDLAAQQELNKLPPGTTESETKGTTPLALAEVIRLQELAAGKRRLDSPSAGSTTAIFGPIDPAQLELSADSGVRQDPATLRLGQTPESTVKFDLPPGDPRNRVQPFVQEKFEDLVGKLLEEADELGAEYQTLKLSTNQNNNDPGEIAKQGGRLNSTGAVAATGNKKPPTTQSGGVARLGRQGARATGAVAANEGVDRRGRDKALDGQQEIADQPGTLKMAKSDDPQQDLSTGVGGKKVDADETHFSLHNAGQWKDDMLRRLDKPQAKQSIVERQGDKVDPQLGLRMRDLASKQEQVIERLKAIRKELRNLYLPTEHLDELARRLEANLARLEESPDPELFRLQLRTLDQLRGALRVFHEPNGSFQPSLPRDRAVQGRVLDQPTAVLPGYERAVEQYYRRLATE